MLSPQTPNTDVALELARSRCATLAAEMRCPLHGKNARVEVEPLPFGCLDCEVFTCCDVFAAHVRETLARELSVEVKS